LILAAGAPPRLRWVSSSHFPSLDHLKGPTSKGKEGKIRGEDRGKEGTGKRGRGRKGKGDEAPQLKFLATPLP